ncbi:helix-turn-helix transcriptional regulator [Nesterenkonia jeotgali]
MTTKQVSELTGIPEGSLKYFRHRGHGGPRSFALTPRAIRYSRESVLEWISERMQADEQISA